MHAAIYCSAEDKLTKDG